MLVNLETWENIDELGHLMDFIEHRLESNGAHHVCADASKRGILVFKFECDENNSYLRNLETPLDKLGQW